MTDVSPDDVYVDALSRRDIEERALAWRTALGISTCWQPDLLDILEFKLPRKWPDFSVVVRENSEMVDLEAYTQFQPPQIVFRNSSYQGLRNRVPRSRWTAAHELGHLVLHEAICKARSVEALSPSRIWKPYNSAEWQANTFASHFLMPEHVVSEFSSPEEISENCNVSLQAAVIRFQQITRDPVTSSFGAFGCLKPSA